MMRLGANQTILFITLLILFILGSTLLSSSTDQQEAFTLTMLNCSRVNCTQSILRILTTSDQAVCAFYSLTDTALISLLAEKQIPVILNRKTSLHKNLTLIRTRPHSQEARGLMHSKFCVIKNATAWITLTGSYNPTGRLSHDLLIIITSEHMSKAYYQEWEEYAQGIFGRGMPRMTCVIRPDDQTRLCTAFCPEDACSSIIMQMLSTAGDIRVSAFVFTHPRLADFLIRKHEAGARVHVSISSQGWKNAGRQAVRLQKAGIPVSRVTGRLLYHYKLWNATNATHRILITGSMNPSVNGDQYNDETLLILIQPRATTS